MIEFRITLNKQFPNFNVFQVISSNGEPPVITMFPLKRCNIVFLLHSEFSEILLPSQHILASLISKY